MKKMFFMSLAFCLGLGMMSCGNNAKAGAAADSTATEEVKAEAPAKKVDINELVAKAKAEGANWDEAQWKAAYEDMFIAMEPMIKMARDMEEKTKAAKTEDEKMKIALEMLANMEKMKQEMDPLEKGMNEFEKIVEANPIAKKVSDDPAFQAEMKKKFNLPEDF
ncbi:MAG: hypothetical protein J6N73_06125 [Prevotella sp.]|nr:hypothetical protein [Prevotella sp.]